jgi:hypothetical protein
LGEESAKGSAAHAGRPMLLKPVEAALPAAGAFVQSPLTSPNGGTGSRGLRRPGISMGVRA